MTSADVTALCRALRAAAVVVVEEQPLAGWTTLGVGGASRAHVEATDAGVLARVLETFRAFAGRVPLLVIGRGSNLLVADTGWPGLSLRLGAGFRTRRRDGTSVVAGGAESYPALAAWLAPEGLSGLEFAAGIPAAVGGAVRMNAGAHLDQTADRLVDVTIATPEHPAGRAYATADLGFGYRHSELPTHAVVTSAHWELDVDDPQRIRARLDEVRAWRRDTQPLRDRNCGSVFVNPEGDSAGRLVDAAGLKGMRRGGARISEKHANFIVVEPGTRAVDVLLLINDVRSVVAERGGPLLATEVRLAGDFGDALLATP